MKYRTPPNCPGVTLLDVFYPTVDGVVDIPDHINHTLGQKGDGFSVYEEVVAKPQRKAATEAAE